jgi:hypothetical protein
LSADDLILGPQSLTFLVGGHTGKYPHYTVENIRNLFLGEHNFSPFASAMLGLKQTLPKVDAMGLQ